jgi:hypothetical protein
LRTYAARVASSGRRKITVSPYMAPFLVSPNVITSTPVSPTIAANVVSVATRAFEMRAPSRCTCRPYEWARSHRAPISSTV